MSLIKDKYNRVMDKRLKIYRNPKSEECYDLTITMCEFLIPRLKLFKEDASKLIKYDFEKVDKIITSLELIMEKRYSFDICDVNEAKKIKKEIDKGLKILAEEFLNLWW